MHRTSISNFLFDLSIWSWTEKKVLKDYENFSWLLFGVWLEQRSEFIQSFQLR